MRLQGCAVPTLIKAMLISTNIKKKLFYPKLISPHHQTHYNLALTLLGKKPPEEIARTETCPSISTFGSPGSPPPSPLSCAFESLNDHQVQEREFEIWREKKLESLVPFEKGRCLQCLDLKEQLIIAENKALYHRKKSYADKKKMEEDFNLRIKYVHEFWKDKIYRECSRSGKILKRALQS